MDYLTKLNNCLTEFHELAIRFPGEISDCISFNFAQHTGHIVFGSIIHGNEVGSLPAILKIIHSLANGEMRYGGKVSFFLGNKKAALQHKRFTERDLNRSFGLTQSDADNPAYESLRALEISSLLRRADVFFDFHQTNGPCIHPFYIFPMHHPSYCWAQAAGIASAHVTRRYGQRFSNEGLCADEFVRSFDRPGITLELGQHGFDKNSELIAKTVIIRTLKNMDKIYNKLTKIEDLAKKNNKFFPYFTIYKEPFNHIKKTLMPGLKNFQFIEQGTAIGTDEHGGPLLCPYSGFILFPKYPNDGLSSLALNSELYLLLKKF